MQLVEDYPCETNQQLRDKEDEYITKSKDDPLCLNVNRAYVSEDNYKEKKAWKCMPCMKNNSKIKNKK
jgi:hypothetical protein